MNPSELPLQPEEQHLDTLFRRYREATEFGEPSRDFMPGLWKQIESRRTRTWNAERVARIFASSTVALAVAMGLFVSLTPPGPQEETWVEAIANSDLQQESIDADPVWLPTVSDAPNAPAGNSPARH